MESSSETSEPAVLDMSYAASVRKSSDLLYSGDNNQQSGTCMLQWEDEKLVNDVRFSNYGLHLKKACHSYHNRDYVEKIKEFQFYVDKVKEIVRPGCSPETVNVALSSMSSLVNTLSTLSSKQRMHASL